MVEDTLDTQVCWIFSLHRRVVSFQISDLNTAEPLGPHQPGEICVKAPYVTKGYLNNPQATKEIFDSEGWLRMGIHLDVFKTHVFN